MRYRKEIDGLRAIAVVPVILFHAGFDLFSGGFVGVDIFFVISGYLITSIIYTQTKAGNFKLKVFYLRRIRRIFPALFVVLIATSVASLFFLYPNSAYEYSQSLLSVLFFSSNVYFWRTGDYFATASELQPLLHTWSLAVEEQFYLFFPLLLMFFKRRSEIFFIVLFIILALVSLALSEYMWRNSPVANFFLLPTRAFELLVGAVSALYVAKHGSAKGSSLSLFGAALVVGSIFFLDEHTPFPSAYTLVPVLGTSLVLIFGTEGTIVARLLGFRAFVGIGLISYSAYLWHQPIFALLRRDMGIDLEFSVAIALIALVFIVSVLSYKLVEQPFRNRSVVSDASVLRWSGIVGFSLLAFGITGYATEGFKARFDFPDAPGPWTGLTCHGAKAIAEYEHPLLECLGQRNGRTGDIYLIGDSHASQFSFPIRQAASDIGVSFNFVNTENPNDFPYSFWSDDSSRDTVLPYILENSDFGDIVIIAFHRGRFNRDRDSHLHSTLDIPHNSLEEDFFHNFSEVAELLIGAGLRVVLVKDGPLLNDHDTTIEACMHDFDNGNLTPCAVSFVQDNLTRERQNRTFARLQSGFLSFVDVIDPLPELYADSELFSPIGENREYLMFDRHHLTEVGALQLTDFFKEYFSRTSGSG